MAKGDGSLFGWCLPSEGTGHHSECIKEFQWNNAPLTCVCECHTKQEEN
jgi:hypothetical protein